MLVIRCALLAFGLAALASTSLLLVVAPFGPALPGDGIPFYGDDD